MFEFFLNVLFFMFGVSVTFLGIGIKDLSDNYKEYERENEELKMLLEYEKKN